MSKSYSIAFTSHKYLNIVVRATEKGRTVYQHAFNCPIDARTVLDALTQKGFTCVTPEAQVELAQEVGIWIACQQRQRATQVDLLFTQAEQEEASLVKDPVEEKDADLADLTSTEAQGIAPKRKSRKRMSRRATSE